MRRGWRAWIFCVISAAELTRLLGVVYKSAVLGKYSALKRTLDASDKSKLEYPQG